MNAMVDALRADPAVGLMRRHGARIAFLFGSRARGQERPSSDVDLAVLLPADWTPLRRLEESTKLAGELARQLRLRVDVVVLNDAAVPLRFESVIRGITVMEESPEQSYAYEKETRMRFEDFRRIQDFFSREHRRRLGLEP